MSRPTGREQSSYRRRRDRARRFWNVAARGEPRPGGWLAGQQRIQASLAVRALALTTGEVVLDLGCGAGGAFPELRAAVGEQGRVVGLDNSPRMLTRARAAVAEHGWDNVEVREGDASATPLEPGGYDAAVALYSLSTVPDLDAAVEYLHAALRPGGRVFVGDMSFGPHPAARVLRRAYRIITGANANDVTTALRHRFDSIEPATDEQGRELALPSSRSWPPITYLLARKRPD